MYKKGFTLIELSIVIVIIGLIVAGVVGGQALVRQANLRSIVTDFNKYETAINTFLLSFDQLPGDMNNARDYWGNTVNNGNGDKFIMVEGPPYREGLDAWEHMSRADILNNGYVGSSVSPTPPGDNAIANINMPESSISNVLFAIFGSTGNIIFNKSVDVAITLGTVQTGTSPCAWCEGGLTPKEARSIDSKMDDGVAHHGKLLGVDGNSPAAGSCSAKFPTSGADYNLASTQKGCRFFYLYRKK